MLQVLAIRIAHEYHLLQQLAVGTCLKAKRDNNTFAIALSYLRHHLPEDKQELLDEMVLRWQTEADYVHEHATIDFLAIQYHRYQSL